MFRPLLALLLMAISFTAAADDRPNVILIVADDLGWADLECYGNRFNESPVIDRLASQGVRFTQFYAASAVCSPSRASMQSGQYPSRFGLTAHIPGHWRPFEKLVEPPCALSMPRNLSTLPMMLKQAGYATGHFGKWHLGWKAANGPGEWGYDEVFEFVGHTVPAKRLGAGATKAARLTEVIADKAVAFIGAHADRPFFLHLAHSAVHIPLDTTPALLKKYEAKPKVDGYRSQALYAGVLEEMDASIGRVLAEVEKRGLEKKTIVIFVSDNGGLEREMGGWPGTTNRPLRDEKGTLYEGGIRVPMIVRWPGVVVAGGVCETPAMTIDFLPTILEAVGAKPQAAGQVCDGVSLMPVLRDPAGKLSREALYWHYPHYHHSRPAGAIRLGDFKAIEFFDTGEVELYQLKDDLSETKNLVKSMPEKAAELAERLKKWRLETGAQMPRENPGYDAKRAGEWWSRMTLQPTEAPGAYKER